MRNVESKRRAFLKLSPRELLYAINKGGSSNASYEVEIGEKHYKKLPNDLKFVAIHSDWQSETINIIVESKKLPPVEMGEMMPCIGYITFKGKQHYGK